MTPGRNLNEPNTPDTPLLLLCRMIERWQNDLPALDLLDRPDFRSWEQIGSRPTLTTRQAVRERYQLTVEGGSWIELSEVIIERHGPELAALVGRGRFLLDGVIRDVGGLIVLARDDTGGMHGGFFRSPEHAADKLAVYAKPDGSFQEALSSLRTRRERDMLSIEDCYAILHEPG